MDNLNEVLDCTQKLKLLYVEDDDILRMTTLSVLEILFEEILVATNGQEGLDIFDNNDIDMIITDLNMPILNGIGMINKIREKNKNLPILVMSAYNEENKVKKVEEYNINGYIYKPLELNQLCDQLRKSVEI